MMKVSDRRALSAADIRRERAARGRDQRRRARGHTSSVGGPGRQGGIRASRRVSTARCGQLVSLKSIMFLFTAFRLTIRK